MKSLGTLIKLQKTRVDEQRRLLARLQDRLEAIEKAITEHTLRQAREQAAVVENPVAAQTYDEYLKRAVAQARELESQRQAAEVAVAFAREKLGALFEEQKRYEIAEAERLAAEEREDLRRERIALDEVGSVQFVRKSGK
jgi:flagellar biosynthesis chaperone FliJ